MPLHGIRTSMPHLINPDRTAVLSAVRLGDEVLIAEYEHVVSIASHRSVPSHRTTAPVNRSIPSLREGIGGMKPTTGKGEDGP